MEFGARLNVLAQKLSDDIVVIMRTYFEKPRTRLGWKGLINDPDLDGTSNMDKVSACIVLPCAPAPDSISMRHCARSHDDVIARHGRVASVPSHLCIHARRPTLDTHL